jgi:hypothetical protein
MGGIRIMIAWKFIDGKLEAIRFKYYQNNVWYIKLIRNIKVFFFQLTCRHRVKAIYSGDPSACYCIRCRKEMIYKRDYNEDGERLI